MSNPIRIKGVLYDSLSAACRAYGVMLQTVLLRIKRGETVETRPPDRFVIPTEIWAV